jgi:hypothetical protein
MKPVITWMGDSPHVIIARAHEGVMSVLLDGLPRSRTRPTRDRLYARLIADQRLTEGLAVDVAPPIPLGEFPGIDDDIYAAALEALKPDREEPLVSGRASLVTERGTW